MVKVMLLDGGVGQEIYRRSGKPAHPLWSLQVMREQPEIVQAVHEEFIHAGSRIITVNAYTATPFRLARDGRAEWFASLQEQAWSVADAAREHAGSPHGPVQVAGCLPPLTASYRPQDALPYAECLDQYRAIVRCQPQVDLFLCETIPSITEGRAAVEAARESGKPVLLSFTLSDEDPSTLRSGEGVDAMVEAVGDLGIAGLLLNCSTPEAIGRAMPRLRRAGLPFGGYANGFESVDALQPGGTVDALRKRVDLDPDAYAAGVMAWVEQGARIVGGCCEVGPDHLATLHRRLLDAGHTVSGWE